MYYIASLLKNPLLVEFCKEFNGKSLADVHKSLVNMDKISLIIKKQKLLAYPYGQHIAGLRYEYDIHHRNQDNAVSKT